MKNTIAFVIFTALVMGICSPSSYAQDDSARYQGHIVWEDVVYPSETEAYEKVTKMQMELYAEQNFPNWVGVYSTSDFTYYWVFLVDSYADVDTLYDNFSKINKDVPEKVEAINDAFEGTHESTKAWTFFWDRDLSYNPEMVEEPDDTLNFRFWSFCYVKKGKMDEMKEVFKGWVELASSNNLSQGWNTYIADMGVETPFLFWIAQGKNAVDFYSTNAKDMELLGEDGSKQWNKQKSLLRKYEEKTGWYRGDLSYIPAE